MGKDTVDLRCDFQNRVARLNARATLRPYDDSGAAPARAAARHPFAGFESPDELRARIHATMTAAEAAPAPRRRAPGLTAVAVVLGLSVAVLLLDRPAEQVASAMQDAGALPDLLSSPPAQSEAKAGGPRFVTVPVAASDR